MSPLGRSNTFMPNQDEEHGLTADIENERHTCYISFKMEDEAYKDEVQALENFDFIDKSLDTPIDSDDEDYVLRKIREDYLSDSTVTIHLIGTQSAEALGWDEQRFIKRELQASLYSGDGNTKSGVLGVVLPDVEAEIYKGSCDCSTCGSQHTHVALNDSTCVTEFSYNFYLPNAKCAHAEEDRYCVLASWSEFTEAPNTHVHRAFQKRTAPIASETRVRP